MCKSNRSLEKTAEDPTNSPLSSMRGKAYIVLAEAYDALAILDKVASGEQREHWRAVRSIYDRSLRIWQEMRHFEPRRRDAFLRE